MNKQAQVVFGLGIIVALIIGIFIGRGLIDKKSEVSGMHKMPDGTMMANNGTMASMMHDMNASLYGKTGDAFDQAFLEEMVVHHEGAVEMAKKVLDVSKRPELIKLANDIISAQTKEIKMMNDWKVVWFHK